MHKSMVIVIALAALFFAQPVAAGPLGAGVFSGASGHKTSGSVTVKEQGGQYVIELGGDFFFDGAPRDSAQAVRWSRSTPPFCLNTAAPIWVFRSRRCGCCSKKPAYAEYSENVRFGSEADIQSQGRECPLYPRKQTLD